MKKIALVGMAGLLVAGCGAGPDKSREDAADTHDVDKDAPHVIAFNNRYPNVETKCDHGNRIYVVTQGTYKFFVVPHDPSCGGRQ